jgi:hypothetical protein
MGSSSSTNSQTLKQTIETRTENSSVSSFVSSHGQSIGIYATSESGDATVSVRDTSIEQRVEAELAGSMKAVMDNAVQTDLSQVSTQMAKASTSGFNFGNFSSASNSVNSSQSVFQTMINNVEQKCEQSVSQDISIGAASKSGDAKVEFVNSKVSQIGTSMANCVGDLVMRNTAKTSMSQAVQQTAVAETVGLSFDFGMYCAIACFGAILVSTVVLYMIARSILCNLHILGALIVLLSSGSLGGSIYFLPTLEEPLAAAEKDHKDILTSRFTMREIYLSAPSRTVLEQQVLQHRPRGSDPLQNAPRYILNGRDQQLQALHASVAAVPAEAVCIELCLVTSENARSVFQQSGGRWVVCMFVRDFAAPAAPQPPAQPLGTLVMWAASLFPTENVQELPEDFTYRQHRFGRALPLWHDAAGHSQRMPPPRLAERSLEVDAGRPQLLPSCRAPTAKSLRGSRTVSAAKFNTLVAIQSSSSDEPPVRRRIIVPPAGGQLSSLAWDGAVSGGSAVLFSGSAHRGDVCVTAEGWVREWDRLSEPPASAAAPAAPTTAPLAFSDGTCGAFRAHMYAAMDSRVAGFAVGVEAKDEKDESKTVLAPALMCGHESSASKSASVARPFPGIDGDAMQPAAVPSFLGFRILGSARLLERLFRADSPPQKHTEMGDEIKKREEVDASTSKIHLVVDLNMTEASPGLQKSQQVLEDTKKSKNTLMVTIIGSIAGIILGIFMIIVYYVRFKSTCGAEESMRIQMMGAVDRARAAKDRTHGKEDGPARSMRDRVSSMMGRLRAMKRLPDEREDGSPDTDDADRRPRHSWMRSVRDRMHSAMNRFKSRKRTSEEQEDGPDGPDGPDEPEDAGRPPRRSWMHSMKRRMSSAMSRFKPTKRVVVEEEPDESVEADE